MVGVGLRGGVVLRRELLRHYPLIKSRAARNQIFFFKIIDLPLISNSYNDSTIYTVPSTRMVGLSNRVVERPWFGAYIAYYTVPESCLLIWIKYNPPKKATLARSSRLETQTDFTKRNKFSAETSNGSAKTVVQLLTGTRVNNARF